MNLPLPGKSTLVKWVALTLLGLILLAAAYVWATLSYSYADGERAGYLIKLSRKGWVCKTWEGEMQMISIPGAAPEKFYFTVRDDAVAAKINTLLGRQITLSYTQHVGVPSSCFGDTPYFAHDIAPVGK
ncbi:hypothetical protein [Niveibacterium terrae]|uniref:hypothetical protein n=1 Tax=Niveibacterium terrae TaxID=3373598 RepID=UPI003A9091FC